MPIVSYGYNESGVALGGNLGLGGRLVTMEPNTAVRLPIKDSEVIVPSDMIAMGDNFVRSRNAKLDGGQSGVNHLAPFAIGLAPTDTPPKEQASFKNHRGQFNRVYVDGHLETEDMNGKFVNPTDDYLKQWNSDNRPNRIFWSMNPPGI